MLPFTLTEVDNGRVAFEGTPSETLYNPMGAVHGGFAMTLLDSAMTCAVMSALAAGELCTTVETKVSFVRPVLASTGPLRAEAHVIHAGSRVATAEGRLTNGAGRLYAHGTYYVPAVSVRGFLPAPPTRAAAVMADRVRDAAGRQRVESPR